MTSRDPTSRPGGAPGETASSSSGPSSHWLVRVVERTGSGGSVELEIPPETRVEEAWNTVGRALGLTDSALSELVGRFFRMEVADLSEADPFAFEYIPEDFARRHLVFPVSSEGRRVVIATADPTDLEAERLIRFTSGLKTVVQIASPRAIKDALDSRFSPEREVDNLLENLELSEGAEDAVKLVEEMGPEAISETEVQSTPVVKLTNLIIKDGIVDGASDVHIEPGRKIGTVRYRVDGVLRKHMDLPMSALNRVISRIKILSRLDIADRLRPQDGKARVQVNNLSYDLRVSTLPAGGAEKCVIRILDPNTSVTLEDLSVPDFELARLRELLSHREGIVVMTGPTGSGKTSTLYGALRELADGKVNIMTVEDPIEYELPSITQTQVENKQGLTFASALRSILRQDPDVILVGEIRDRETAETAAQAAMTGHLVLATVHANDAVSAVPRLVDLGLQYGTIASTLRGALAQRLLRKVCPSCAEPALEGSLPEEANGESGAGAESGVRAVGCADCGFTGYRGRIPVMEVMVMDPRIGAAIEARKGSTTLGRLAEQGGMRSMYQVGLDWVAASSTTLEEVERVLGQGGGEETAVEGRKGSPRVLLVDEDEDARGDTRSILEGRGLEIREAEDGPGALEMLKADSEFSLVIVDTDMSAMDGRTFLDVVRGSVDTAALPVLIRTAAGSPDEETVFLNAGADDYISKTLVGDRLVARVKAIIRRSLL